MDIFDGEMVINDKMIVSFEVNHKEVILLEQAISKARYLIPENTDFDNERTKALMAIIEGFLENFPVKGQNQ